ncbi:MAG TPA: MEDS domain-containing protein [Terracidiphilus sp.]|nr:MEDS domain-containing protein [Terracidiphilus sp.]
MSSEPEIVRVELPADLEVALRRVLRRCGLSPSEFITEAVIEKLAARDLSDRAGGAVPRHRCLLYEGPPSKQLPTLAAVICQKIEENYRCLYLNSPTMVTGMASYLAAQGRDVLEDTKQGRLVLSSDQHNAEDGLFDVDAMLQGLGDALDQALKDGYRGLWASGDMTWEFGRSGNFSRLLEYEWRLEEFFGSHPELEGICQYHVDTLPPEAIQHGRDAHPAIFVNETLSLVNLHYHPRNAPA